MKKLKVTEKKYQILSVLVMNTIGKKWTFHHMQKIGKSFNQIINQ